MFKKPLIAVALATACTFALESNADNNETLVISYSERDSLTKLTDGGFVEVIDRETIEKYQARSLGELLAKLPSITSYDLSGNGLEPVIGLRGFGETASQNTLITLNGIPMNPATNEGPLLGAISLESIERIEIRPRGSSVLHGEGAVAGVVNLVTTVNPQSSATVELGDFGKEKLAVSKSASEFSVTASIQNIDGYRTNTDEQSKSASFDALYAANNRSHHWFGQFEKANRGYLSGSTLEMLVDDPKGGKTADRNKRDFIFLGYKAQLQNTDISIGSFQSEQDGTVSGSTDFTQSVRSIRGNIERKDWSADAIYGVELHFDDAEFDSPDGAAAFATTESNGQQRASSIYGKRNLELDDHTTLTVGGRYTYLNVDVFKRSYATGSATDTNLETDQDALSFEFAVVKRVGLGTDVSLATNRSVRFATIDEQQSNAVLPSALQPQIGTGINFGIARRSDNAGFQAEVYHLNLTNEIGFVDNAGSNNDGNFNIEESERTGVNVASNFDLSKSLNLGFSASYIDAKATSGAQAGKRIPLVAMRSAGASLSKQLSGDWQAEISWVYESEKTLGSDYNNEGVQIGSQSKTDLSIEKRFGGTGIKFGINNLFDQLFYSYGVRGFSTINGVSGFYDFFVPADPRRIALSINTRF